MASDKRTAKARERLRKRAQKFAKKSGWWSDEDPVVDDFVNFAESERSSAIKEAREECARAVCQWCALGHSVKFYPAQKDMPWLGWSHPSVPNESGPACEAAAIRALGER